MPERSLLRGVEIALAAAALFLAVLGLTLLPLTSPLYVRTMVRAVDAERLTGLGAEGTLEAAETVRRFVLDPNAPDLPERIGGQPAFDTAASSHLVDVRDVLVPARTLTLVAAALTAVWLCVRRKRHELIAPALRAAAAALLAGLALAAVVGLSDFDSFFTWFHGLFFAEGTWVFPVDALIIRVFPLPFWMASAGAWAVLVFMSCVLLFICAQQLRIHAQTNGV